MAWGAHGVWPDLARFVQQLIAAFSGIPYLGAFCVWPPGGHRHFVTGIILAIMIIPFIAPGCVMCSEVTPALL